MKNVRIGIVGIGNMGSAHAVNIFEGNVIGLELVAVCDSDSVKLEWAQERFSGKVHCFEEYEKMMDSGLIDAVLIATPHKLHPTVAQMGFQKRLNVLSEKPAGVYTAQVRQMNEAAKASGKIFGLMYNQRTNPIFRKVHELVKGGKLGELKRCVWIITNWYRTQAYYDSGSWRATWDGEGGGVLLNQCPHNLDIWQWIFGMPTRVRGFCQYGKYHNIEVDDDVTAYAEYENGATAVFIATTGEYPGTNRLEISGDKGKIVVENGTLKFWELTIPERTTCFEAKKGFLNPDMTVHDIEITEKETAHTGILQNFTNAILYGEPLIAPGEEGINGLTISNAIYLSDWTDGWVTLPLDERLFQDKLQDRIETSTGRVKVQCGEALTEKYSERWSVRW